MNEEQLIQRDRMRFKKNKLSANLALLAIVLDVLYFVNVYQSDVGNDVGNYYYNYMIGISVIYNLVFMLAAFLSEEGVKNYKKNFSIMLVILGVIQIARIFILPWNAHTYQSVDFPTPPMGTGQFLYLVALLVASAVCLVASAVVNYIKCNALAAHMQYLEEHGGESALSKSA